MNRWGHFQDTLGDVQSKQPIWPSNILTMKSNVVLPPPGHFVKADEYSRKRWRRIQHIVNEFWVRWWKEFLWSLQPRHKWNEKHRNFQNGDIVLLKTDANRNQRPVAKVVDVNSDAEGFVRSVTLLIGKTRNDGEWILERQIHKIILLMKSEIWFPDKDVTCQDDLTSWGEPVLLQTLCRADWVKTFEWRVLP